MGPGLRRDDSQPPCFLIIAFASSSSAGPLPPFAPTSVNQSAATPSVAFFQRSYSAAVIMLNVAFLSIADLRAGAIVPSQIFPAICEAATPLLLSITFLRSAGRLSYFAWFMATTKMVFDIVGRPGGVSVW